MLQEGRKTPSMEGKNTLEEGKLVFLFFFVILFPCSFFSFSPSLKEFDCFPADHRSKVIKQERTFGSSSVSLWIHSNPEGVFDC